MKYYIARSLVISTPTKYHHSDSERCAKKKQKNNIYTQAAICQQHTSIDRRRRRLFPQYVYVSLSLPPCSQGCFECGPDSVTAPPLKTHTYTHSSCSGMTAEMEWQGWVFPERGTEAWTAGVLLGLLSLNWVTVSNQALEAGPWGRYRHFLLDGTQLTASPSDPRNPNALAASCISQVLALVAYSANLSAWAFPRRASTSIACPPNLGRGTAREAD